jgi:hypothetical protein
MRGILLDDESYSEYFIKETEFEGVVIRLWGRRFGVRIFDKGKRHFSSKKM